MISLDAVSRSQQGSSPTHVPTACAAGFLPSSGAISQQDLGHLHLGIYLLKHLFDTISLGILRVPSLSQVGGATTLPSRDSKRWIASQWGGQQARCA